eukprot:TRINITY_DN4509_c0_g1_i1.p1 TRINITY_DN4509_c0_g1~~TRINITY_DN4509_c0_g1_i1.p1  ORF type:complete len:667 (-),score=162.77 TRINITY_DN4509_c0_g1_i1:118-2118(-)
MTAAVATPAAHIEFATKIYDVLANLPKPKALQKTGTIRLQASFKTQNFWIPAPRTQTIAWLIDAIGKRYTKLKKQLTTIEKLTHEKGSLLDPEDIIGDLFDPDDKVFAYGTVEESTASQNEGEKFVIERKQLRDEETGKVIDTQVIITFIDISMIEAIRYFISSDIFYDKRPRVNAEALLQYCDQFRQSSYNLTLQPLTDFLDSEYEEIKKKIGSMLTSGKINYASLWSIFPPNGKICCKIGASKHFVGSKITSSKYNRSTWFPSFDISAVVIKSNGHHFYRSTETYSIPSFSGVKKLKELPVRPLDEKIEKLLEERGRTFTLVGRGAHYLNYAGNIEWKQWWTTSLIKADGRVMIDGVSFSRMNPNYRTYNTTPANSTIVPEITDEHLYMTWPTIGGFSFSSKKWGEVLISNTSPVHFDDKAFDKLVFPIEKKSLIKSLVETSNTLFSDIISGKGGGCIFLLHGSPGVGKTLTAEAIAELLHRPLYSVSVGELGTNTKELEKKLKDILELAGIWNAVILIDEADIFLEKRSENDIVRNAMVGIFLRLLEYHQGVLFLTTNRVRVFDEAFHSRISIALKYEDLNSHAREQIWTNLLDSAALVGFNPKQLGEFELNGRQIRTTIRLAQSLAHMEKSPVTENHIRSTVDVANQFVTDLMSYDKPSIPE